VSENFQNSVIKGLKWVSLLNGGLFASRFIVNLILAALLVPKDFGLIAIVTVFTEVFVVIADLGFNAAIIQKKEISKGHLSTAFILNIVFSSILVLFILLLSGLVADFYNEIEIEKLINILSAVIFIRAISSVQLAILDRNLNFKKIALISLFALLFGSALKIILAYLNFGASSIVYGEVLFHFVVSLLLWITSGWRPQISLFNKRYFNELFGFGSKVMISNVIELLSQKADIMIIGKLVAAFSLGLYSFAYMISTILMSFINSIIQRVIFPGFSRIQHDSEYLKSSYLAAVRYIAILSLPVSLGLIFIAPEFVGLFLDYKWQSIVPIIQLLGIWSVSNALGGVLWSQIIKAVGNSGLVLQLTIVRLVAIVVFIIIGSRWGILGIAASIAIYGWIFRFVYQHITNKVIGISMIDYLKSLIPGLTCGLLMSVLLLSIEVWRQFTDLDLIVTFIAKILVGFISYSLAFKFFFKNYFENLKKLFV